jgi:formate hydrogenlyase subunit 6/NADH:ubiquinone oxidoreductase subunit I
VADIANVNAMALNCNFFMVSSFEVNVMNQIQKMVLLFKQIFRPPMDREYPKNSPLPLNRRNSIR